MADEYKPRGSMLAFRSEQCKASVYHEIPAGFHQCRRKPWKDGWCKQHHPESEAKRRAKRDLRYQRETELRLGFLLGKAHEEVVRLKARIAELEASE